MSGRKISCIPCRSKKARCDRENPCSRCSRTNKADQCVYPKPGSLGRPPKNAVFRATKQLAVREFVFEYPTRPASDDMWSLCPSHPNGLRYYIENIYNLYSQRGQALRYCMYESNDRHDKTPRKRLNIAPIQHFTWLAPGIVNLLLRRLSQLHLEAFTDLEIALQAFAMMENTPYFTQTPLLTDPLQSLPPEEALRLIDIFFDAYPYSVMLNKTLLLRQYWDDTIDPALLSTIFGIALYVSRLGGQSPTFWGAMTASCRNPFLDHAHILLQDATAEATLGKYQGIVLLSAFESIYGLAKRGISLLALSYMLASQLGILDNRFHGDPIEQEIVSWTFWSAYVMTIYGCVELGLNNRDALALHKVPFPPMNIYVSASFGVTESPQAELVESFYSQVVIAQFSYLIFRHTPRPQHNLFGAAIPNVEALEPERNVEQQMQRIVNEFAIFVDNNRLLWSPYQRYMIETTLLLYKVHLRFLQPALKDGVTRMFELPIRYLTFLDEIDPANPEVALRLGEVLPTVLDLIHMLKWLLHLPVAQSFHIPHGLMEANLETCARLLMLSYQWLPSSDLLEHLKELVKFTKMDIWRTWNATKLVRARIESFLKHHLKRHRSGSYRLKPLISREAAHESILAEAPDIFQQFLVADEAWLL
ncbi:hypothetical protein EC973_000779 [Apophysomyces ossiformis]|uniref:Zn(2)-C6 fungal-type domain-containing protein n=1 Tax=Apophysomyces ossiformis TaxID=679940 RepID=A0A8H7BN11_9FUNG|nr:hypothetical protein EC973_000779 [Apophysomyces ossiformis]